MRLTSRRAPPVVGRDLLDRPGRPGDAGVVDQNVDAAELLERQLEQAVDRCLVGDVGRDRRHLGQLAAQPVERRLVDIAGDDARTCLDEGLERDPADPGPARSQHHPLVIEPQIHTSPPQWLHHAPAGIKPPVTGSAPARLAAL